MKSLLLLCGPLFFFLRIAFTVETYGGTGKGLDCQFPFSYNGKNHSNCITENNNGVEWCYVNDNKDWGNCIQPVGCKIETVAGEVVVSEYTPHKDSLAKTDPECLEACNTDHDCKGSLWNDDTDTCTVYTKVPKKQSDPCCTYYEKTCQVTTYGGNANGAACEFPFTYNAQMHRECIRIDAEGNIPWCATTSDFDKDKLWGNCKIPDLIINDGTTVDTTEYTGNITVTVSTTNTNGDCIYVQMNKTGAYRGVELEGITSLSDCKIACSRRSGLACTSFNYKIPPNSGPDTKGQCFIINELNPQMFQDPTGWITHYVRKNCTGVFGSTTTIPGSGSTTTSPGPRSPSYASSPRSSTIIPTLTAKGSSLTTTRPTAGPGK